MGLIICLDAHRCLQKLLDERKRLKKAKQYLVSDDLTKVTPEMGENKVATIDMEDKDEDNENQVDKDYSVSVPIVVSDSQAPEK